jgi:hypothetical protein
LVLEQTATASQAAANRADRAAQAIRSLLMGQALEVTELDRRSIGRRQARQRFIQNQPEVAIDARGSLGYRVGQGLVDRDVTPAGGDGLDSPGDSDTHAIKPRT